MGERIKAKKTQWGEPWNHHEIALRMDALLQRCGVDDPDERVRMTAHAVIASGWRQNVWWYNAWGVKRGKWPGDYYQRDTKEENKDGELYDVPGEQWRAFGGWCDAVEDFRGRIAPESYRRGYEQAYQHLVAGPGREHDAGYWEALGNGGYYTDTKFTPAKFAKLCDRIRRELASAKPEAFANAKLWANQQPMGKTYRESGETGLSKLALIAILGTALWVAFNVFAR